MQPCMPCISEQQLQYDSDLQKHECCSRSSWEGGLLKRDSVMQGCFVTSTYEETLTLPSRSSRRSFSSRACARSACACATPAAFPPLPCACAPPCAASGMASPPALRSSHKL